MKAIEITVYAHDATAAEIKQTFEEVFQDPQFEWPDGMHSIDVQPMREAEPEEYEEEE